MQVLHENRRSRPAGGIILVSTPWPMFNRPSIQLGSLKAYINRYHPQINVKTAHLYLPVAAAIGYDVYQTISERTWLAESVYAGMLYPERQANLEKLFLKYASGKRALRHFGFDALVKKLKAVTDNQIEAVAWGRFDLVGFSVCLCQLTSTLYYLRAIKKKYPSLKTVVGGTSFPAEHSRNYLEIFPEIDFIVSGEGERPLSLLVQRLCDNRENGISVGSIAGLAERSFVNETPRGVSQLNDLKSLPPPDYNEYFEILSRLMPEKRFFPTIPVEASRGCWWKQNSTHSGIKGCAFCNLNLQWRGYRTKESTQLRQEIDTLSSRHQILSLAFMDNVLPYEKSAAFFNELGRLNKDLKLFAEIRAGTPLKTLQEMHAAGMTEVQIGIEALSSRLLRKMNKGVSLINNMEIMRDCEALGIKNEANLILCFPGSDEKDVAQTLATMDYAWAFRPLRTVHFWLGLGSPLWQSYRTYGLRSVYNHPYYQRLFPKKKLKSCPFIIQAYRGDLTLQRQLWRPVIKKVRKWRKAYAALRSDPFGGPILGYRDGRTFLLIRHKCYLSETVQHRINGTSRKIYLFCRRPRSVKKILTRFPQITEDRLMPFLNMMTDKRLMFEDGGQYLSLAVPVQ